MIAAVRKRSFLAKTLLGAHNPSIVVWLDADLEKKVGDLTPEQISAAVRKFLDAAKLTSIKAGDFAKTTAAK